MPEPNDEINLDEELRELQDSIDLDALDQDADLKDMADDLKAMDEEFQKDFEKYNAIAEEGITVTDDMKLDYLEKAVSPDDYADDEEFKKIDEELAKENAEFERLKRESAQMVDAAKEELAKAEAAKKAKESKEAKADENEQKKEQNAPQNSQPSESPKERDESKRDPALDQPKKPAKKAPAKTQSKGVVAGNRRLVVDIPGRDNPSEPRNEAFINTKFDSKKVAIDSSVATSEEFEKQFKSVAKELLGAGRYMLNGSEQYKDLKKDVEACSKLMDKKGKMKPEEYKEKLQKSISDIIDKTGKYFDYKKEYSEAKEGIGLKRFNKASTTGKNRYAAANKMWNLLVDQKKEAITYAQARYKEAEKAIADRDKKIQEFANKTKTKTKTKENKFKPLQEQMVNTCKQISKSIEKGDMPKARTSMAELVVENAHGQSLLQNKNAKQTAKQDVKPAAKQDVKQAAKQNVNMEREIRPLTQKELDTLIKPLLESTKILNAINSALADKNFRKKIGEVMEIKHLSNIHGELTEITIQIFPAGKKMKQPTKQAELEKNALKNPVKENPTKKLPQQDQPLMLGPS